MEILINPDKARWPSLFKRQTIEKEDIEGSVSNILNEVERRGDQALNEFIKKFENRQPGALLVPTEAIKGARNKIDPELRAAIDQAAANIRSFHQQQRVSPEKIETMSGVNCWWQDLPIERVGLYIPGGTAPLISTFLMLGIPAVLAGCEQIVACTPPTADGEISPALLYAADVSGVTELYAMGGAQAIAALAFGTQSVRAVDKIFGPGNQYVTCAKMLVNRRGVAIDMPAGPSEVAIVADTDAPPSWVAADLLAQAEHGNDSQVLLITFERGYIEKVLVEISAQLEVLPRANFAKESLKASKAVVVNTIEDAMALVNFYAPEHLILAQRNPDKAASLIRNAGSVFLGYYSPESVGDYASGTNHVLPTNGFAKVVSGVGLQSFMKRTTFQQLTSQGLTNIGPTVMALAEAEGLEAHKRAVSIRFKEKL